MSEWTDELKVRNKL